MGSKSATLDKCNVSGKSWVLISEYFQKSFNEMMKECYPGEFSFNNMLIVFFFIVARQGRTRRSWASTYGGCTTQIRWKSLLLLKLLCSASHTRFTTMHESQSNENFNFQKMCHFLPKNEFLRSLKNGHTSLKRKCI